MRLLFVCLGNICRSPTGEGVMRRLVAEAGLAEDVSVDSAGTSAWHVGSAPDPRSAAAAARRGTALEGQARQVVAEDFAAFDLLLCADRSNASALLAAAPDAASAEKVRLLREFDPASRDAGALDVPDPYLGEDGFDDVLDLIEAACAGLLDHVRNRLARRPVRTARRPAVAAPRRFLHVAQADAWARAQESGSYPVPDGPFTHGCYPEQLAGVLARFYGGVPRDGLVLLEVDPAGLPLEIEPAADGAGDFPHVYGPIPAAAVVSVGSVPA